MALAQEDIEFIKTHLGEWLAERSLGKPPAVYEIELRERMVRVEEELKHQRELMREGFAQVDKRFEQIDKRLEQIDKRLDQQRLDMDKRFEQVDKRFEAMQATLDKRFDEMLRRHDQQFFWLLGFIATGVGLVIAALRYL
jgi:uncharacterized membrane protein YccC